MKRLREVARWIALVAVVAIGGFVLWHMRPDPCRPIRIGNMVVAGCKE